MAIQGSSFPDSVGKLTTGINLREISSILRAHEQYELAEQVGFLSTRIQKLETEITTADQVDFEKYLAWDIIKAIRRVTHCPDEASIVSHCEALMNRTEKQDE